MSPGLTHLLRPETTSFVISRRILTQEGFCEGEHRCGSPLDTLYVNLPPSYEILVLWETCHIYATCQAYRAEADFQ